MIAADRHLSRERLEAFATYDPLFGPPVLERREREHLASCSACLAALDAIDPSASLGLLGWLPEAEPLPPRPRLPERAPSRSGWRIAAGLAAAAAMGAVALGTLLGPPAAPELTASVADERAGTWPGIVRHVESETATVVTLVPPGSEGPTVTLILDEGLDL